MKTYYFNKPGDYKVLKIKSVDTPQIKDNEILIKNQYIGINQTDIHVRKGELSFGSEQGLIGVEGGGIIEKIGKKVVKKVQVGDKVAYCTQSIGSYAEYNNVSASAVIPVPEDIDLKTAVAALYRGITAHALYYHAHNPIKHKNKSYVYVNGALGGVGHILIQMLAALNVAFIAGVGDEKKMGKVAQLGAKHVFNYNAPDFLDQIKLKLGKTFISAIYDCIGEANIKQNLEIIAYVGTLINYGDVSGMIKSLNMSTMRKKALNFIKPELNLYRFNKMELLNSAQIVYELLRTNQLTPIIKEFQFKDIPAIHKMMEERKSIGVNIVKL